MDQISRWKQLASLKEYKDPQAAKCLKAVELGFNKCIRLPRKLKGRPRVSITDELKEYPRIVKELEAVS